VVNKLITPIFKVHVVLSTCGFSSREQKMYLRLTSDEKPFLLLFVLQRLKKSKQIVKQLRGGKTKTAPNNPAGGL